MKKIKVNKRIWLMIAIYLITAVWLGVSWVCTGAVDWYRLHVFPLWQRPVSALMSLLPFSFGEIMIIIGIVYVCLVVPVIVLSIIKRKAFKKTALLYVEGLFWIVAFVFVTETFNCFVFYHATTVNEEYFSETQYNGDELLAIYNEVVDKSNELAEDMPRDEQGNITYDGDIEQDCIELMKKLSDKYPMFKGNYPRAKKMIFSDIMSQQYMCGVYFPFSLEANYNKNMGITKYHHTICHELTHLKGVIYEDEANYYSYVACIESDNKLAQYSAYLSVINYLYSDCFDYAYSLENPNEFFDKMNNINPKIWDDDIFVPVEKLEEIEDNSIVSTEKVNEISDAFYESNLKANGISQGMISYSEVVKLLMGYYDGKLY